MSAIRSQDTKPELLIRRGLHALGFRFRLHDKRLPGRPDIVFASRRAVIEVHGCYWHGHECPVGHMPGSNLNYWSPKIERNKARDEANRSALREAGWRTLIIWECATRGTARRPLDEVLHEAADWLRRGDDDAEIAGLR